MTGQVSLGQGELRTCDLQIRFIARDPLVVRVSATLTEPQPSGTNSGVWWVSRDLLRAGLIGPAGMGEVQVIPVVLPSGSLQVAIHIHGQGQDAKLLLAHQALHLYLERTSVLVPIGREMERVDIDGEIDQLLDDNG
ncbi:MULTISPECIES: SsgA family sporulation/cell division regulator [Streptomyces]|uniref:SsgA family sporulation/cell division regulator n=1 Tax=Streptomyces spinosisporus TaxID=2927582 RepID=A0ABS9XWA9_9ACTN|nr:MULTISPECIES: SsgA family sporulation/cell division regulator [Streptomyces]MCI3246362.1 SsgA family sporulation/cell division regulator [Streptomyces spinosisporus]WUB33436.1 SsgA family sporulation/cell division regulator [Streptomyces sp. NBC_00588]WUB41333.1 SsgA family sporulation/cell division regulator [Streptomyces sp. NBC_00588]